MREPAVTHLRNGPSHPLGRQSLHFCVRVGILPSPSISSGCPPILGGSEGLRGAAESGTETETRQWLRRGRGLESRRDLRGAPWLSSSQSKARRAQGQGWGGESPVKPPRLVLSSHDSLFRVAPQSGSRGGSVSLGGTGQRQEAGKRAAPGSYLTPGGLAQHYELMGTSAELGGDRKGMANVLWRPGSVGLSHELMRSDAPRASPGQDPAGSCVPQEGLLLGALPTSALRTHALTCLETSGWG